MQFLSAKKKASSSAARNESYDEEEESYAKDGVLSSADFGFGSAYGGAPARSAVATAGVIGEFTVYTALQLCCEQHAAVCAC
jgi:hypothetical protein